MHDQQSLPDGNFTVTKGDWLVSDPVTANYYRQKGITLRWRKTYSSRCDGSLYMPVHSLMAQQKSDTQALRRWQHLWAPRLTAAALNKPHLAPYLFPGHALPSKADKLMEVESGLQYCRFTNRGSIAAGQAEVHAGLLQDEPTAEGSWPWKNCPKPEIKTLLLTSSRLESNSAAKMTELDNLRHGLQSTALGKLDQSKARALMDAIHQAWSPDSNHLNYDARSLTVVREILSKEHQSPRLLNTMFELELFASYSSILMRQTLVGSGFYDGTWIDVFATPISELKATERCEPVRVLDELLNLRDGKTAPIVINEFGCVADGNHRLTAAVLWNILNRCTNMPWVLSDATFQDAVANAVQKLNVSSQVALHEALTSLAVLLKKQSYRRVLKELMSHVRQCTINSLPSVLIMEYSSLAIVASEYEGSGTLVRLAPHAYQLISERSNVTLPARACYHFADHVPLPWFSLIHSGVGRQS